MDTENPVIQLCIEGTQAEYARQPQKACEFYQQAWAIARDDYERCIAAHYVARCQQDAHLSLQWNQKALQCAMMLTDPGLIEPFLPSLYINLGAAWESLGDIDEAQHFYQLAGELGKHHLE